MSDRATSVSPIVLTWARERAGYSLADVAARMSKDAADIAAWEAGTSWPTYMQLEKLAESVYRRPVALFFFPEPPDEPAPQQEFRTLPDFDIGLLSPDTRFAARLGRSYQESLRELSGGVNPAPRRILEDVDPSRSASPASLAAELRSYLGVTLDRQRAWRTTADAMAGWRAAIEDVGVFVFKRSFKQREISGFCLTDEVFPIIMVNNSTPFTRQIFTLFHELCHLLHRTNSITTIDGRFVDRMTGAPKSVEVACNEFAAEFLVPASSFPWTRVDVHDPVAAVASIADSYNVSREVILRRILGRGLIDATIYSECVTRWARESEAGREGDGGNYYYNQAAYLGDAFLKLAFSRHRAGLISTSDLADHLRVKAKNVSRFEDLVAGRL